MSDHAQLQCDAISLAYNFTSRTGRLDMAEGDCCDMSGCIRLFEAIDPHAAVIKTFSGAEQDTEYQRSEGGLVWFAIPHFAVTQE